MKQVLKDIFEASINRKSKLLAVLIDPDKFDEKNASDFFRQIPEFTTHIFVGGSTVESGKTEACIRAIKMETDLPVIIFPGDHSQITSEADALLFLSLISGRNPEYLIEQQVRSVSKLKKARLEIMPTGYLLIDGGKECAVQRVSNTVPLCQKEPELIVDTALAGEYSGKKLIYLEAGSGADYPVSPEVISLVKNALSVPLIVGGGIRSKEQMELAYEAGADMIVVGTAFENGNFLNN